KIISQPESMEVKLDSKIELSVEAEGGNLEYKWFFNNNQIAGEVSKNLVIDNFTKADDGDYYCEVSGKCGEKVTTENINIKASTSSVINSNKFSKIYYNHNKISFLYNSKNSIKTNLKIIDLNGKEVKGIEINLLKGQ